MKGRVLLEIPFMHKSVQYFQTLHRNQDIYELKGVHIATFEHERCSISNVNTVNPVLSGHPLLSGE